MLNIHAHYGIYTVLAADVLIFFIFLLLFALYGSANGRFAKTTVLMWIFNMLPLITLLYLFAMGIIQW